MTSEEYERRHSEIVEDYMDEIDEHESAGCYGDDEVARKWMCHKLAQLKKDYDEGANPVSRQALR